jgi:plastocyanin
MMPRQTCERCRKDRDRYQLRSVEIRFVDVAFVPSEVAIPGYTEVTLRFLNDGVAAHNFKIAQPDTLSGYLAPGGTAQVAVNLLAGSYPYFCTIPGHAQSGMSGVLIVE